jgi:hypothetical protein
MIHHVSARLHCGNAQIPDFCSPRSFVRIYLALRATRCLKRLSRIKNKVGQGRRKSRNRQWQVAIVAAG